MIQRLAILFFLMVCMSVLAQADDAPMTGGQHTLAAAPTNGSLWGANSRSLYTDASARHVGDLLTVVVVQESSATTSAKHTTSKGINVDAGAGSGMLDFFTGFGVKTDRGTSGAGSSTASTRIVDQITVTVKEVLPNGNLRVEGSRSIRMEKDEMSLVFSGVVRPEDIPADNRIVSTLVADQKIEAKGTGPIAEKRRPGILSRLLSILW